MTPHRGKFISYLRVSTKRQGESGLGLEAQRAAVTSFLNGGDWQLVEEHVEVESGKADHNRPVLQQAIAACRLYGAKLVIAKLDRLSRDPVFLLGLRDAGIDFVAADMPHANRLTVGVMAMVAEQEREAISHRTKAALAAAKARGTKLGGVRRRADGTLTTIGSDEARAKGRGARTAKTMARARDLAPIIEEIEAAGAGSLRAIATALNDRGITTPMGGEWSAVQVSRVLMILRSKENA